MAVAHIIASQEYLKSLRDFNYSFLFLKHNHVVRNVRSRVGGVYCHCRLPHIRIDILVSFADNGPSRFLINDT